MLCNQVSYLAGPVQKDSWKTFKANRHIVIRQNIKRTFLMLWPSFPFAITTKSLPNILKSPSCITTHKRILLLLIERFKKSKPRFSWSTCFSVLQRPIWFHHPYLKSSVCTSQSEAQKLSFPTGFRLVYPKDFEHNIQVTLTITLYNTNSKML